MNILPIIKKPADLKAVKKELLPQLCKEIREKILEVVSKKGGHLGASLGATEITVALHTVFDAPKDKIIWDTGHQAYGHKLLTGRFEKFESLRQYGGISGFLSRKESEYDVFGGGHASTAISAALGIAAARDHKKEDFKVVAIVSDGCITGGMAYEGLQNAGNIGADLLVVLNDNQMFISHRVGAMGTFLAKLLTLGIVTKWEKRLEKFLARVHFWGSALVRLGKRLKVLLFPGILFEEMGFSYFGPVDGHDIFRLMEVLEAIKKTKGPSLLHIITKKGKGYEHSEKDVFGWHAPGKFDVATGEIQKSGGSPTPYTKIFGDTLVRLAKEDQRIVAVTAAMPEGTGTDLMRDQFPERFYDVGLAEQHAVTFAGGMAAEGLRPVVAIYSTFLQRAFDQMEHDISLQNLPVVFILDRGGIVGDDGPTHHGVFDYSYIRMLPNFIIMAPKDENELQHMLYTALKYDKAPIALRYPRGPGYGVPLDKEFKLIPIGQGEIVKESPDSNISLLAIGSTVVPCLEAAKLLQKEGIPVTVVNMRFVKPIDKNLLIKLLEKGNRKWITVEENVLAGGFGSAIMESMEGQPVTITRIGIGDHFVEHGTQNILRDKEGLSAEKIAEKIRTMENQESLQSIV
ncbi:MAG: 1-deoxy-D-xylulose-5-phosphate synthase [Elusimicrobia bacterium RIFCSPLOWO2_02_FULL_39_32]|nr:MAG: 1-deoxy-D-xylulose-5-phosphate synthase [Elusimicrobia bacterium RIFCSPHIGHO2_02_FULL_39_36]OGR92872.1 MAG: 1-deoxy-D-xylulose-5-phosphate synthase [Elusimicrobia bacterium RIFCSPLOWO2_02_FULL_39_32]OGR99656.1 MAG: 1-deoxy-D-xylulose-5-phosphate synthase [Elusimicrobia bacterium RIFCSPLOWO2_12_FULL_39_28]